MWVFQETDQKENKDLNQGAKENWKTKKYTNEQQTDLFASVQRKKVMKHLCLAREKFSMCNY